MVKKKSKESENSEELSIPIPIQIFLWRQTSPFMRSKLSKICESSSVSFERVIVQNILHGLSPSLCEAISSIPRWKLIRAAFPHVIHCCASVLAKRQDVGSGGKYSSLETKLLYTLHWIVLDAASECEDSDSHSHHHCKPSYLHSLDTIQLFIFLLIPLLSSIKRPEIESLKLLNGLRLWEPLWSFNQPSVPCFITPVKAKKALTKPIEEIMKVNFNLANIYLGDDKEKENKDLLALPEGPPLVSMSDICALSNRSSMEESMTHSFKIEPLKTDIFGLNLEQKELEEVGAMKKPVFNALNATYFDIAALQCLFCPQWKEEGVVWTLNYLVTRLREIKKEVEKLRQAKKRSRSLPSNLTLKGSEPTEKEATGLKSETSAWNVVRHKKKKLFSKFNVSSKDESDDRSERRESKENSLETAPTITATDPKATTDHIATLSSSDSKINYNFKAALTEVPGSSFYIRPNGHLKYDVILLAIYNLSVKHYGSKVCSSILSIINCFIDLGLLKKSPKNNLEKNSSLSKEKDASNTAGFNNSKSQEVMEESVFNMTLEIIFRLIRVIGCAGNCSQLPLKIPSIFRDRLLECLTQLIAIDIITFKKYVLKNFLDQPLQNILDCLHVLLRYCSDPIKIHLYGKKDSIPVENGYKNDFGEPPWHLNSVGNKVVILIWKRLLNRLVRNRREIITHENIHLYQGARQLVAYMREANGSTFRKVALSFLLESSRFKSSSDPQSGLSSQQNGDENTGRQMESNQKSKFLFKKKHAKHSFPLHPCASEDLPCRPYLSPRTSIFSIAEDDVQLLSNKKKSLKMLRNLHKSMRTEVNEDTDADTYMASEGMTFVKGQRMSFKATGQATLRLLSARRKIEDGFKSFGRRHHTPGRRESICETSILGGSQIMCGTLHHSVSKGSSFAKERRLLNSFILKSGLARFNILMEFSNPGVLPDPPLIAALLDLDAPVVGRAALLLECAYFVNRCNHGDWSNWMKYNMGGLYSSERSISGQSQASRNLGIRRNAGRLFHQWAESLGSRLSEIMIDESPDVCSIIVGDERQEAREEEEDYLDEDTVNRSGSDCPHALKLAACQLLYEVTAFLRETHKNLPRVRVSRAERSTSRDPDRRWSSVLTTMSNEEPPESVKSAQLEAPREAHNLERKISFAISRCNHRSGSVHENAAQQAANRRGRMLKTRRGSEQVTAFKPNRSFKLIRSNEAAGISRVGSTKSRKISTQSLHSAASAEETIGSSYAIFEEEEEDEEGEETDDLKSRSSLNKPSHEPVAPKSSVSTTAGSYSGADDFGYERHMPWVKVVVQLANKSNFVCEHQTHCHPNCYERQRKSCLRLMVALKKIYSACPPSPPSHSTPISQQPPKILSNSFSDKIKHKTFKEDSIDSAKQKSSCNSFKHTPLSASPSSATPPKSNDEETPILKYLEKQVANLTHSPLSVVIKATPILKEDIFIDIMPIAWELILESDQELAAAAATVFLISSIQVPEQMRELLATQFQHTDVSVRIGAIIRFGVLWNSRFQVWPRMELGAQNHFKLPPPSIDFVVPSPTIGLSSLPVVDPPWTPHFRSKLEEVTIDQKDMNSVVTATTTRRKQQQQMLHQAMLAKEDKRRLARERCWITSVPVCQAASVEPVLHTDDHEDAIPEELSLAVATRRMSVAVVNRASNVKNLSARHGSIFYSRPTVSGTDEERIDNVGVELQVVQSFFPSPICQSAVNLIYLLSDLEVNKDGVSVSEVTEKTIWRCLVEEPSLFLRTFLEKLTEKTAFRELIWLIRRMLNHLKLLPLQTSHCIFNYLLGYIMFYERLPSEGSSECITEAMSLLWQIAPFVSNIYFKDLKQTLRKEQCDGTLLVAANTPSAKKLIIHGPDLSSIPSQYLIQEDTQFEHLLQESLEFFNIPQDLSSQYFLVDTKTRNLHNLNRYVRDHYTFRRNFYPQLSLVQIDPHKAHACLQKQTFMLKYLEMEKVLFSLSILTSSRGSQFQNHVSYLHEELLRLPSFPRKALETEFSAYYGEMKEDIMGMDVLHKLSWIKLMATMFRGMSGLVSHDADLPIFLNVLNGILIIHSPHCLALRTTAAAYINVSRHFKHVFASTGFSFIMPTILSVHISNQHNPVICGVIHFLCKCFFVMHRNAFVLQMFATMSCILEEAVLKHGTKKHVSEIFFQLLTYMQQELPDSLNLLELLDDNEEVKAFDFCYKDDSKHFTLLEAIRLCATVVAYNSDSIRSCQMLTILEAILPHYLQHQLPASPLTQENTTEQLTAIQKLSCLLNVLIASCESMTRNFNRSQFEPNNRLPQTHSPTPKDDNQEFSRLVSTDERMATMTGGSYVGFVKPRNHLLLISCHYYKHCHNKVKEITLIDPTIKTPDLLDHKSHIRLADIAHSLLKVAAHDPLILNCAGLQKYMSEVLAHTNWSQVSIRSALNVILRRLDRLFGKILKNTLLLMKLDWETVTNLVKAIDTTLYNCPFIGHLPQMKALVSTLLQIVTGGEGLVGIGSSYSLHPRLDSLPPSLTVPYPTFFSTAAIHLALRLLSILGDTYSMENMCEGTSGMPPTPEKLMCLVSNLLIPSILQLSNHKLKIEHLKPAPSDVLYSLSMLLHAIHPTYRQPISFYPPSSSLSSSASAVLRTASNESRTVFWSNRANQLLPENFNKIIFLGLKSLITCFDRQLSGEWHQIARVISQMISHRMGGVDLWSLVDFIVSHKGPLFILLLPIIKHKLVKNISENSKQTRLVLISHKLKSCALIHKKSPCFIMQAIENKLEMLKDKPETKRDLFKNELQLNFSLLEDALKSEKINEKRNSKKDKNSIVQEDAMKSIGSEKNENERQESESGKDLDEKQGNGGNKIEEQRSLKKNLAFSHTLNHVVDVEQGNLILYRHFRNRKDQEVEKEAFYSRSSNPREIFKGCTEKQNKLSPLRSEVHRLQRQDAKSRKTFKFKRVIGSFNKRKDTGVVRSATVKGQTRDLKPLRRGRDTASADVALKEDEKDEVRRLIPYRRHESPSDALHKRYKSRFVPKQQREMRGVEMVDRGGSDDSMRDEKTHLLTGQEEAGRSGSAELLQITDEDLKVL